MAALSHWLLFEPGLVAQRREGASAETVGMALALLGQRNYPPRDHFLDDIGLAVVVERYVRPVVGVAQHLDRFRVEVRLAEKLYDVPHASFYAPQRPRATDRELGGTIDGDDFAQVVGNPYGRGPVEHLGKVVGDFSGVGASSLVVGQRCSEAVEDPRPLNDVKMVSPHNPRMIGPKHRSSLTGVLSRGSLTMCFLPQADDVARPGSLTTCKMCRATAAMIRASSSRCHNERLSRFVFVSTKKKRQNRMTDLSPRELLVLREIHLTGQTTQKILARQFIDKEIIVDVEGNLNVTSKGRSLLVRGSPSLWQM